MLNRFSAVSVVVAAGLLVSCNALARRQAAELTGGNPERGASSLSRYGCGSCHIIPGISGAHGQVGPSLDGIGARVYVAGTLTNQPVNLIQWVRNPQSVNEKTVMPNLGVTPEDATDIAAYLYSLK